MSEPLENLGGDGTDLSQTDQGQSQQQQQPDPIKNLKGEFNRKFENTNQQLMAIAEQLNYLNTSMRSQQVAATAAPQQVQKVPDPLTEPDQYAAYVEQKVEQRVSKKVETQQKKNAELASLASSYPELQKADSELTRAALQAFATLSDDEKLSPMAYRLAVQSAAAELGILPAHKRAQLNQQANSQAAPNNDEGDAPFMTNSSNNNQANSGNRKPGGKKQDVDQKTIEFAKLLGRDVNDPKVIEGLKKASARKNWSKYKGKGEE